MNWLKSLALLLLASSAVAGPYSGSVISTTTGKQTDNLSGVFYVAKDSTTHTVPKIVLDGASGSVGASSFTAVYGVKTATAQFTGTGQAIYSIVTSSGISVAAGGVTAPFLAGELHGSHIVDATIVTAKLGTDAVTTTKIIDAAVVTAKLGTDSVTTTKIVNAAVTTSKLASASVSNAAIIDLNINLGKLAQSGASTNDSIVWNGSLWAPGSGAGTNAVTSTATPSGSGSNTSFSSCMSGSTITMTMSGGRLEAGYTGSMSNTSGTGQAWFVLLNGSFFAGTTGSKSVFTHLNGISSTGMNNSGTLVSTGTYTGTVSLCMGGATNSGTWVVPSASAIGFTDIAQFHATEIK